MTDVPTNKKVLPIVLLSMVEAENFSNHPRKYQSAPTSTSINKWRKNYITAMLIFAVINNSLVNLCSDCDFAPFFILTCERFVCYLWSIIFWFILWPSPYCVIQKDGPNFVRLYFLNYTWYVNDLHNIWKRRS